MLPKKEKIALFLGGTSPEKEVSKSTAKSIYAALQKLGYETVLINPAYGRNQPKNIEDFFSDKEFTEISNKNYVDLVNSDLMDGIDLVFLALHGKWGEDGTIQALLELKGIKYTGSKVLASAISIDKEMSKILFNHYGIKTPKWFSLTKLEIDEDLLNNRIKKELGFPCVIKPNDQGSTVGVTICKKEKDIAAAVNLALEYSNKVIIEEYIAGKEMTVAVLNDIPLPVLEIKPKHDIYDYESKYTSGMSEYFVPADIPEKVFSNMQEQALSAFKALGCEVYSRVDFRLSEKNESYCLEVNTLPGMTSTSLVPKMAKAAGITFEELIERIVKLSKHT
jgi:D-alanine-D-alanine ligase